MMERLRQRAVKMAEGVAAAGFALLFLRFVVQVVMRFLFNRPLAWADERNVVL